MFLNSAVGGAKIAENIFNWMVRCFPDREVFESYGSTEVGGISFDGSFAPSVEFRLESIPEMNYKIDDKPNPRGELLIKTNSMFSGYLNSEEETRNALTADGFFRTGDVVELLFDENSRKTRVRIIDRKKNFFKFSHGEFVSSESIEQIFSCSPLVEQIFVTANILDDSIRCVVVPKRDFPDEEKLKNEIFEDFLRIAESNSIRRNLIPKEIIIENQPFTVENGFLTSSMKLSRFRLKQHYENRWNSTTIETRIERMFATKFDSHDSLSALRLSRSIQQDFGVSLPLSIFFDESFSKEKLIDLIKNPAPVQRFVEKFIDETSFL